MIAVASVAAALLLGSGTALAQADEAAIDPADYPGAAEPTTADEVYGEMVRSTAQRSPDQQRDGFHLPPGFEIEVFASEPQIAKPINMAVDDSGRLWVTQTTAYPHPAPGGTSATDAVKILADTRGDGRADAVTTFAAGLNIPIGILPYGDGCLCFSIPNIWYLRDTNGDGRCDRREVVLGPFDTTRDTHGMVNALRDGGDGWIYACHGFSNQSVVAGSDGHQVRLESGNTFRFRPDGSRIERYTQGQVNPFGMTRDGWGYWFTADCHSKPITQLIRGGCYPSFGRPHDGLGFLPPTIDHLHGSTAISGILYIPHDSPAVPLRDQLISGNVMTSRINRDLLTYRGATARGIELPDFMTSDDPWFRPVDLQMDARGDIYVADFYNKIIGHYEVPLDHPERDRDSGRVWRIRYVGDRNVVDGSAVKVKTTTRQRIDQLRALAERDQGIAQQRGAVVDALASDDAHVARAAAEVIGDGGQHDQDLALLVDRLLEVPEQDPVLRQSIRIAIRQRLLKLPSDSPLWDQLLAAGVGAKRADEVASILLAVPRSAVVAPLVDHLSRHPGDENRQQLARHAIDHADEATIGPVVGMVRRLLDDSLDEQSTMLDALLDGSAGRGASAAGQLLNRWAEELAQASLDAFHEAAEGGLVVGWNSGDEQGWPWQQRQLQGAGTGPQRHAERGDYAAWQQRQLESADSGRLRSSHGRGESYTGTLVSDPFPAPPEIRFRLAGHGGHPDRPDHGRNLVRLVRQADSAVLRETRTPRSDIATLVHWTLDDAAGQQVRIECLDGDAGNAFAWLAIGHFEPVWIDLGESLEDLRRTLRWTRRLGLEGALEPLGQLLAADRLTASLALEVAEAIAAVEERRQWQVVLASCRSAAPLAAACGEDVVAAFQRRGSEASPGAENAHQDPLDDALGWLTSHLSASQELAFARLWVRSGASAERLVELAEAGWVGPRVIIDAEVDDLLRQRAAGRLNDRLQRLADATEPLDQQQAESLQRLLAEVRSRSADAQAGAAVFKQHCANCHQLLSSGSLIGPQLDGVVTRSVERLFEDIILPDSNVDAAFRTTRVLLDDGRAVVGMVQSEDDQQIRLADATGKTITVPREQVELRRRSPKSLMPSNFAELLSAADLANLIQYIRNPK